MNAFLASEEPSFWPAPSSHKPNRKKAAASSSKLEEAPHKPKKKTATSSSSSSKRKEAPRSQIPWYDDWNNECAEVPKLKKKPSSRRCQPNRNDESSVWPAELEVPKQKPKPKRDDESSVWPAELEEPPKKDRMCLPKRKRLGRMFGSEPKQKAKPKNPLSGIKREVSSRSPEFRREFREYASEVEQSGVDLTELHWDIRGPKGPLRGGPQLWLGQHYRETTERWGNSGGRHREKYKVFRAKKKEGLDKLGLHYWHPMSKDGFWAKEAAENNVLAPWEERKWNIVD